MDFDAKEWAAIRNPARQQIHLGWFQGNINAVILLSRRSTGAAATIDRLCSPTLLLL